MILKLGIVAWRIDLRNWVVGCVAFWNADDDFGLRIWVCGSGFGVLRLWFVVWGLACGVWCWGFRIWDLRLGVWGVGVCVCGVVCCGEWFGMCGLQFCVFCFWIQDSVVWRWMLGFI